MDHRQGVVMAASGSQHDVNTCLVRGAQCSQIALRDLKLRIQQRAININCYQADGWRHLTHCTVLKALPCFIIKGLQFWQFLSPSIAETSW